MSTHTAELGFITKTLMLARKDLRIEARARETLPPMLAFCIAVGILLSFALPGNARLTSPLESPAGTVPLADVVAGFLWITIMFSALIGFARTFEVERQEGALDSLRLLPVDRSGLFAGKALANLVFIIAVEAILVPVFALLFGIDLGARWATFALVVVLVDVGLVATGTLLSTVAAQTRSRELMLPILALPALVPVTIAAVRLSSDLFLGGGLDTVTTAGWFAILVTFDVVAVTVGSLAFEFVLE